MLEEGLAHNAAQAEGDRSHIAETTGAVSQLRTSFDRVNSSNHARFADMHELGDAISSGSSEVLGQLQYQDIVRQCVERLQNAVARRNDALGGAWLGGYPGPAPAPAELAGLLSDIVEGYLAGEAMHGGNMDEHAGGALAIELF
jgi:methyl-accepting chemotaxis protein